MLGNDHFKPFPNIAKLLYHKKGSAGIYLPSEPLKDYNKLLFLFFYDRSEFFPRNINFCAFIDDRIYMH